MSNIVCIMIVGSIQNLTNEQFEERILTIKEHISTLEDDNTVVLVHGYMDIPSIEAKGWDATKRKVLDREFPRQIPFFVNGSTDREYLDQLTYYINISDCYVIVEPNENVEEEIENGNPTNIHRFYETSESN